MSQGTLDATAWTDQLDAYIAKLNAGIGQSGPAPLFTDGPYSFPLLRTDITDDLLRLHARAVGDANPLWNDPGYAAASPWRSLIGPPILEALISETASMPNPPQVPGCNMLQGGARRQYHEPFRPGDVISAEDTWHGIEEKTRSGRSYRLLIFHAERQYLNQRGRPVVTVFSRLAVTAAPPGTAGGQNGPDFSERKRRGYTPQELDTIRADYETELSGHARRGAEPRFWDDVQVGEPVAGLLKGPYDICDAVAFAGAQASCPAFALKWREIAPDLGRFPVDAETNAPHHAIDWHFDDQVAHGRGLPYAIAFGTQMEMMLMHSVTNWISDAGFVTDADLQIRSPLMFGDVSRTSGTVTGKRVDRDRHLVELKMTSETLDGIPYATGTVAVDLPTRAGYSPAERIAQETQG